MSYIVSEISEAYIAACNLRGTPKGVRLFAIFTVVLLASLFTATVEGQYQAQQLSAQAGGEAPRTPNRKIEARLAAKAQWLQTDGRLNLEEALIGATFAAAKKGTSGCVLPSEARGRRSRLSPVATVNHPGGPAKTPLLGKIGIMGRSSRYSPEDRERASRMALERQTYR